MNRSIKVALTICLLLPFVAGSDAIVLGQDAPNSLRKIALLVGVADYESENVTDLKYTENDVRVVGSQLKLMGFDVTSLTGSDATRDKTIATIDGFIEKASELESTDIVFVMFSGHGQQLRVRTETSDGSKIEEVPFFCPVDSIHFDESKVTTRGKSESEIAEELNFVSLNRVLRGMDENSNSLNNLLVVDACRNNPSKGKSAGISGTSATVPRGVNIIFAAGSGQKSWESASKETEHGVFTHFLIKGLQGDAKNRRDQVTWSRLASYLQDEVAFSGPALAGEKTRVQNPHSIINSTNLIVLGKATSDELIEERLYQSLRNPNDVFDLAELCQYKELVIEPVYAAMMLADEAGCKRGLEILRPHIGSDKFGSLPKRGLNESYRGLYKTIDASQISPSAMISAIESLNGEDPDNRFVRLISSLQVVNAVFEGSYYQMDELPRWRDEGFGPSPKMVNKLFDWLRNAKSEVKKIEKGRLAEDDKQLYERVEAMLKEAEGNAVSCIDRIFGKQFPEIVGKDLLGKPISTKDYLGKVLILDFVSFL